MMVLGHLGLTLFPLLFKERMDWDIRLLVIGAFLPDLIDKPLGHLIMPLNNGRLIGHTIVFAAVLIMVSVPFRKVAPLAFGVVFHQLLDGMFMDPRAALWPLLGPFETYSFEVSEWLMAYSDPWVLSEEIAGLLVISILVFRIGPGGLMRIARTGKAQIQ